MDRAQSTRRSCETLKKLGIRLAGQTAGVLQYYDKDENGQMEDGIHGRSCRYH